MTEKSNTVFGDGCVKVLFVVENALFDGISLYLKKLSLEFKNLEISLLKTDSLSKESLKKYILSVNRPYAVVVFLEDSDLLGRSSAMSAENIFSKKTGFNRRFDVIDKAFFSWYRNIYELPCILLGIKGKGFKAIINELLLSLNGY